MVGFEKRSKRYPTDLTDEEWLFIQLFLPSVAKRGRTCVMSSMRFAIWSEQGVDGGCCRMTSCLGKRYIGGSAHFVRRLLFRTIHDVTLTLDREREGREQNPTAAVVDSQSIKATAAERRGFDAEKKVVGRKRHIAVDTDGRLLMVNLTTADISDSAGAQAMVAAVRKRWP